MKFARDGYTHLAVTGSLAAVGFSLHWILGLILLAFFIFTLNFFRDPDRDIPPAENSIVSSADGTVLKVEHLQKSRYFPFPHQCISIFMSPLNVHVNRVPMQGSISDVQYHAGKFFNASLDKASEHNERCAVWMKNSSGEEVCFVQIAGFIARRIVCPVRPGMFFEKGQRYGMIKFGSRMEMYLPAHWKITVKPGDKLNAGASIVANF